jgi:tetratricopeptide (TPR) repeat protein
MLVQQFSGEKLTADPERYQQTKTLHLRYFVDLAETAEDHLRGAEQAHWLARLQTNYDNLLAALEYAEAHQDPLLLRLTAALWQFWWISGRISEGRQWLERSLELHQAAPAQLAKGHYSAGYLAWLQADFKAAERHCQISLEHYRDANDDYGVAISLDVLGITAYARGHYDQAIMLCSQSLALLTQSGQSYRATVVRSNLAQFLAYTGKVNQARAMHEENLRVTEAIGDSFGHALTANVLGMMFIESGDITRAKVLLATSLNIKQQQNDLWGMAFSFEYIAHLFIQLSYYTEAATLLGAAEALREELASPIPSNEQARYEDDISLIKKHLGTIEFSDSWQKGRQQRLGDIAQQCFTLLT